MFRKLGKKKRIIFMCLFLLLAGSLLFFLCKAGTEEDTEKEIVLKQGQSFVYGQIAAIYGNEITYYVMSEGESSEKSQIPEESSERPQMPGESSERPQMPEESGERPQIRSEERGERPQMPEESGERPQMGAGGRGKSQSSGEGEEVTGEEIVQGNESNSLQKSEREMMPRGEKKEKKGTEKMVTVQIPVGTKVTTRLGAVTTFSRLAAGDNIKMLVQEEAGEQVILELWIVE